MGALIPFSANGFNVRTTYVKGEVWFVAKDACECLGLGNVSQAISRLDQEEKGIITVYTLGDNITSNDVISGDVLTTGNDLSDEVVVITDSLGRRRPMVLVNEWGIYSLMLTSRKEEALAFKRWITREVIPSIRKTGSYSLNAVAIESTRYDLTKEDMQLLSTMVSRARTSMDLDSFISEAQNIKRRINAEVRAIIKKAKIEALAEKKAIYKQLNEPIVYPVSENRGRRAWD